MEIGSLHTIQAYVESVWLFSRAITKEIDMKALRLVREILLLVEKHGNADIMMKNKYDIPIYANPKAVWIEKDEAGKYILILQEGEDK